MPGLLLLQKGAPVSGQAMLFINPHTNYYGFGSFYEGHVYSGEGWNFSGATRLGAAISLYRA